MNKKHLVVPRVFLSDKKHLVVPLCVFLRINKPHLVVHYVFYINNNNRTTMCFVLTNKHPVVPLGVKKQTSGTTRCFLFVKKHRVVHICVFFIDEEHLVVPLGDFH